MTSRSAWGVLARFKRAKSGQGSSCALAAQANERSKELSKTLEAFGKGERHAV